ncbi:glycosyltransferase family 2 protein [Methylocystis parvus]|uniref:glycosyltransferase family 2 protein n=1 Tax=Methylocystis parvus TaxID=134 RepID=UPI00031C5E7D|nr:glycosyltransferase family 2 protein [Methylocystis parvus]WBK00539.1 glycosyltransferase [Methylocystis parvus OBBP]
MSSVVVSVIIPAYNAAAFLGAAIASLQAQTLSQWEAIIVDDASTDGTLELARRIAASDFRVRVLALDVNSGPSAARNAGFAVATGEWIALLDADDVYLPARLSEMIAAAERLEADILADNQWLRDPSLGAIVRSGLPRSGRAKRISLTEFYLKSLSASGFDLGTLKPIFRASLVAQSGVQYRPLRYGEDFVFFAELLALGARAWRIPQPYYVYTLTTSEVDGNRSESSRTLTNYDLLLIGSNSIMDRYAARLSTTEKVAIRIRAYFIEEYKSAVIFKDQRRNKQYRSMLATLLRHPLIFIMILRGIRWRLRAMLPDQRYVPT